MKRQSNKRWKVFVAVSWTAFTLALTSWWLVYGLRLIARLEQLSPENLAGKQRMLFWEGGILILLLLTGGGALVYSIFREFRINEQLREFFATFSHDLKTSLTSMRLQVESLENDLKDIESPHLARLGQDTVRLQIQLENALFLAKLDSSAFFKQEVELGRLLERLAYHWPKLIIHYQGKDYFRVDTRAFESILTNIIQNSVVHGKAKNIFIKVTENNRFKFLEFCNDGVEFQGKKEQLGKLFFRHYDKSGSGVGLYLVRSLVEKMNGSVDFYVSTSREFCVKVALPVLGLT